MSSTTYDLIRRAEELIRHSADLDPADVDAALAEWLAGADDKAAALRAVISRAENEADYLASEAKSITAAGRARAAVADQCRSRLKALLQARADLGEPPTATGPGWTASLRESVAVEIADPTAIPADYLRVRREPDKGAIKAAMEAGQAVPGAELRHNVSVSIRPAK